MVITIDLSEKRWQRDNGKEEDLVFWRSCCRKERGSEDAKIYEAHTPHGQPASEPTMLEHA